VPKHRLYIRRFLNLPHHHGGGHLLLEVADTTGQAGSYPEAHVRFELADCARSVALDFPLRDASDRRNSLRKARLLAEATARLVEALEAEADLAARRESERKAARAQDRRPRRDVVAWMVHAETAGPVEGLTEDAIDDLVDALAPYSGAAAYDRKGHVSATLTIESCCRADASALGEEVFRRLLAAAGLHYEGWIQAEIDYSGGL
jgi:hypothetical protein